MSDQGINDQGINDQDANGQGANGQNAGKRCANCGAPLTGPFCAVCGQSEKDIRLPILTLASDVADGLLSWDGRLVVTLRALYTRPGRIARDYCDGKRAAFTAPIRLYLLISLFFFAALALAGVRVVAVELMPDKESILAQDSEEIERRRAILAEADASVRQQALEAGEDVEAVMAQRASCGALPGPDEITPQGDIVFARDTNIVITLFQHGEPPEPRIFTPEMRACVDNEIAASTTERRFKEVINIALTNPEAFERRAAAAAGQALILVVAVFILMNMLLHPRRRVIEHVVYALYFHAALLPFMAAPLLLASLSQGSQAAQLALAGTGFLANSVLLWAFDRGFYGSSWWGALLRMIVLSLGYTFTAIMLALGLILLPTF